MKKYENYKDSGNDWVGEMPKHWELIPLKYLVKCNEESLSERIPADYPIKYIEIGNVSIEKGIIAFENHQFENAPSRARRILKEGDIIISTVRTYLKAIASISEEYAGFICSTGFAVLTPQNVNSSYLNKIAQNDGFISEIISLSKGVSYPSITSFDLLGIKIPVPPISEQEFIANYLDRKTQQIDALIEKKERLIALLEEERTGIINQAVTKGLDPNAKMKDSGIDWLGEIPEGWDVTRLKYCFESFGGFAFSSSDFTEEGIQLIKIGNLYRNKLDLKRSPSFVDKSFKTSHCQYLAGEGDILISLTGTLGKRDYGYAILIENDEFLLVNQRVGLIRKKKNMNIEYAINMFHSESYLNRLFLIPTGTKQGNLSCNDILSIAMPIPSLKEQEIIGEFLHKKKNEFKGLKKIIRNEIELLQEYKTTLISEVVTGKIDVREEVLN